MNLLCDFPTEFGPDHWTMDCCVYLFISFAVLFLFFGFCFFGCCFFGFFFFFFIYLISIFFHAGCVCVCVCGGGARLQILLKIAITTMISPCVLKPSLQIATTFRCAMVWSFNQHAQRPRFPFNLKFI